MIVYRNYKQTINTIQKIETIEKMVNTAIPTRSDFYDLIVSLLIECGELETGITDFYCDKKDTVNQLISICRKNSILAGSILNSICSNGVFQLDRMIEIKTNLCLIKSIHFPAKISLNVPEGFVYYGLYPEIYLESTSIFFEEIKPENIMVVGLRSIGTPLSALVAARLETEGCNVKTLTIRPKGHPYNRFPDFDDKIRNILQGCVSYYVIVVDEGPGLSGSSIGGTLSALRLNGIDLNRTVVFPSWVPSGDQFISENSRNLWQNCKKFCGSFEKQWILNGKLEKNLQKKIICDLSAGMWRGRFLDDRLSYPPVHPHHEKRKYLLTDKDEKSLSLWVAKFCGLGKYGSENVLRADKISSMGYSPVVKKLSSGFAVMEYVPGKIVRKSDVDEKMIEFVKDYLMFINKSLSVPLQVSFDQMLEMIFVNIEEGLGGKWYKKSDRLKRLPCSLYEDGVVSIDGHMMPHDFLITENGIIKVDHIEHHNDQFFHGPQNICWDIAGFFMEFELDRNRRNHFLQYFSIMDPFIIQRQSFFNVAYLAYRLGYVTLAADYLRGGTDGIGFEHLKEKYCTLLKIELSEL
ncbi:MAG TPA: hypothetical protein VHP36_04270 [Chitinispirillaceae bacterium]|nr:hypothetical protein [Chitinispirillaceae bacterium]